MDVMATDHGPTNTTLGMMDQPHMVHEMSSEGRQYTQAINEVEVC